MIVERIKETISFFWGLFLNGLITLLPITITLGLFSFSFKVIKGWLAPLKYFHVPFLSNIPNAEIIVAFAIIFVSGVLFKSIVVRSLLDLFEYVLERVPLVRPVYLGVKHLVQAFSPSDTNTFQRVVLVEFPRKGMYSIGFQTSKLASELAPTEEGTFYSIFIPTTPNPTTGYFIIVRKEEVRTVDLTTQEAMALIISGGIVQPHRFKCK